MSKFFVNRLIVAIVISIVMVIACATAMLSRPTAPFPNIADPQIQVTATYPAADAVTADQSVATSVEQQMSGVDNMEYLCTLNANNGQMKATVDFEESRVEQAKAMEDYQQSVKVSLQRYTAGKVLNAQQLLNPAEYALAQTELNQRTVIVQLYLKLGDGGWNLSHPQWP
jgi:multidrug efflux pump subunit AcrB